MPRTLHFSNLPLIRVEIAGIFDQQIAPEFDLLQRVRSHFQDSLPIVDQFMGGTLSSAPFSMNIGPGQGASYVSRDEGLSLQVRPEGAVVTWSAGKDWKYPRFAHLHKILSDALGLLERDPVKVVMSYVNHVPTEQGELLDLIQPFVFPERALKTKLVHDLNVSYRLEGDLDFRLQLARTDRGFLLTTSAGKTVDSEWSSGLATVHETLIEEFAEIITPMAKKVWELC